VGASRAEIVREQGEMMESFGALVGWTHQDAGDRIMLRLESVQSSEAARKHDPDLFRFLMTRQQAAILGNYLVQLSGQPPIVPKKRGWFRRRFG
jgi:hypothetical protein